MKKATAVKNRVLQIFILFFGVLFCLPIIIFCLFVAPYFVLKDTIDAHGVIIWYEASRKGMLALPNYVLLLMSLFLWGVIGVIIFNKTGQVEQFFLLSREQKQFKSQLKQELVDISHRLSPEEKQIEKEIETTNQNIAFCGFVSGRKNLGYFCCCNCGLKWQARINHIKNRKRCKHCATSYQK